MGNKRSNSVGTSPTGTRHLLEVKQLRTVFPTDDGEVKAVDGVSFHLDPGETLGIVGESGCGKSVMVLSIMRLLQPPGRVVGGEVLLKGRDLLDLPEGEMEKVRGAEIAMIFQDPMTSMNPVYRIGWQLQEPLRLHARLGKAEAKKAVLRMLERVGMPEPEKRARMYPHMFSGGMRQRAMIAMCLTTSPSVLIADEPTTALDVTIQAQILELLREINTDLGTATILITHNLGVVAGSCERVLVMYAGKVVEEGLTIDVFKNPKHPYTWALLRAIPRLDSDEQQRLMAIEGSPPDLSDVPSGCAFHPRCPFREARCVVDSPSLTSFGGDHRAACWVTAAGAELTVDRGDSLG
ncbi:MAG: ABC transporter ATP-binding protein [Candidatus Dormibacteraeota bacterium]|nr:ABC transporter ATP-binding protein [Candidatus Dormibacteraeota bacterium]